MKRIPLFILQALSVFNLLLKATCLWPISNQKLSSSSQWTTCILVSILRQTTARRTFHVTSLFYPFTDFTLRYLKSPYIQAGLTVTTKDLDGSFVHSYLAENVHETIVLFRAPLLVLSSCITPLINYASLLVLNNSWHKHCTSLDLDTYVYLEIDERTLMTLVGPLECREIIRMSDSER